MVRYLLALSSTVLAGCASIPYGEFDGKSASPDTRDVVVAFVDGQLMFDTTTKPVTVGVNVLQKLEPGHHVLHVRIVESESTAKGDEPLRELAVDVAPCTKHRFVGRPVDGDWTIAAIGEVPIVGCKAHSNWRETRGDKG